MTNTTFRTIYDILTGKNVSEEDKLSVIRDMEEEMAKNMNEQAAKAAQYEAIHDAIMEVLHNSAVALTISEIWERVKGDVPEGTTKGQVQYAITRKYASEIVKIEGNPNEYRL